MEWSGAEGTGPKDGVGERGLANWPKVAREMGKSPMGMILETLSK